MMVKSKTFLTAGSSVTDVSTGVVVKNDSNGVKDMTPQLEIQAQISKHQSDLVYLKGLSSPTLLTKKSIAFAERKIDELKKLLI